MRGFSSSVKIQRVLSPVTRPLLATLACVACFILQTARGIGPTLPIELAAHDEEHGWEVTLRVDTRQARVVKIERQLYSRGEQLRSEPIEPKYEKQTAGDRASATATLSLRSKEMETLKPGAYAQRLVIEGQWLPEGSAKPLHIERWFYFVVKERGIERIDAKQYDNITDRGDVTIDSHGRQSLLNQGHESKGEPTAAKSKPSEATPLGRLGGAVEEDVPELRPKSAKYTGKQDQSETQED